MTVAEAIEKLKAMPQDAKVTALMVDLLARPTGAAGFHQALGLQVQNAAQNNYNGLGTGR